MLPLKYKNLGQSAAFPPQPDFPHPSTSLPLHPRFSLCTGFVRYCFGSGGLQGSRDPPSARGGAHDGAEACPKEAVTPQGACAGAGSWQDMWREEPTLELPIPQGPTLWKGLTLGKCIKSSLEDFSRGRNPRLEQGRSVRHPPPEAEGAAETAAPIPHPAIGKEAEEARIDSEPGRTAERRDGCWTFPLTS